jgi:hypothetical protein
VKRNTTEERTIVITPETCTAWLGWSLLEHRLDVRLRVLQCIMVSLRRPHYLQSRYTASMATAIGKR